MKTDTRTKKQKRLVRELDDMYSLLGLDHWNIEEYDREARTPLLELMKNHLVRGEVVFEYTLIDEHLNNQLCNYFFGRGKSHIKLWKTQKFRTFNYHVLEELSLLKKLAFVKSILKMPKSLVSSIQRINALRNGLAHAFFPENLKALKPEYKGKSIFTLEGIKLFRDDMSEINDFFVSHFK